MHDIRYTIEDWMQEYHPELEREIDLVPGTVYYNVTSVVGEGDGYYVVYLGRGTLSSLTSGLTTTSADSQIRNKIHMGKLERVDLEDLDEDLIDEWRDELEYEIEHCREFATEVADRGDEDWASLLNEQAEMLESFLAAQEDL